MITSHFPANLTVRPGEKVNLKCEAVGNPVPVVYWELQHNVNIDGEVEAIFLYFLSLKLYLIQLQMRYAMKEITFYLSMRREFQNLHH